MVAPRLPVVHAPVVRALARLARDRLVPCRPALPSLRRLSRAWGRVRRPRVVPTRLRLPLRHRVVAQSPSMHSVVARVSLVALAALLALRAFRQTSTTRSVCKLYDWRIDCVRRVDVIAFERNIPSQALFLETSIGGKVCAVKAGKFSMVEPIRHGS